MIREFDNGSDKTVLEEQATGGLGRLVFNHPAGTFGLTPASRVLLEAIIGYQGELRGVGIDWGSGVGCLTVSAARVAPVDTVIGLEISPQNIQTAIENAKANSVADKTRYFLSDGYVPFGEADKQQLESLKGKVDFLLSNPPSSDWDDGFGFRRLVMSGARDYLKLGAVVLLNISYQYGPERVRELSGPAAGYRHLGLAAGTDWVPFELTRPELLDCLKIYAREEANGGYRYAFMENGGSGGVLDARKALSVFERDGVSPLSKWQTHVFRFQG